MKQTIVLSLGGSIFYPKRFRHKYIERLGTLLAQYTTTRFIISCGGGALARRRMIAETTNTDKDMAGISAVNENAENIRNILAKYINIHTEVLISLDTLTNIQKHCILGAEKPGRTTDYNATLAAQKVGATKVINFSNISYMYDKNPKTYTDAKPLKRILWNQFFKIIGTKIVPGGNYPFDPVAAKLAQKHAITVQICNGNSLSQVRKAIEGNLIGSIIST